MFSAVAVTVDAVNRRYAPKAGQHHGEREGKPMLRRGLASHIDHLHIHPAGLHLRHLFPKF